jgi:hypothetical protein
MAVMEKYSSYEKAVMEKIHYRCIDVPCCLTCAHSEDFDWESLKCRANKFYTPEFGNNTFWFGDHLGFCDKYKRKSVKPDNGGSHVPAYGND